MMDSRWIRFRSSKGKTLEEQFKLDPDKSDAENVYDIVALLADVNTNEQKRLSVLNALANVFKKIQEVPDASSSSEQPHPYGYTISELYLVLSVHLYHQFTQIRAAALRALRHMIRSRTDLELFNALQLPDLICRSLDIILKNDEERAQALKLLRRMLIVDPFQVVPSVVRCLVSLSEGGAETNDRMLRSCLAVLCEFGVLHPRLLICCGGVSAITRNVLEFLSPRIAESLCGVLLHLLEWPETRSIAGVRLDCLAAPYCDFTYRAGIMDKNKDARDLRFTCSRLALLSILRSWSGIIEFCDPSRASGLKAIVDVLYLNQLEVRKAVLDLLYELLSIPQPVWTDEFSVAFATIDPSDFQDAWRLSDGFVAAEGRSILPTLAKSGPNVCEIHTAMLLYCFLESGLMDALVEVIVSSDTFISVRATVLLGKLTHLMHRLLPADICAASATLPTLIGHATQNNHQATAAIAALQSYHQVLKSRPASCSLFLDCIVRSGELVRSRTFRREIDTQEGVPLRASGRQRAYYRINTQELSGEWTQEQMSSRTFINELKKRRRHNSSGSNSGGEVTMTDFVMNSSSASAGTTGSTLRQAIPSLKRTGSIKLNKFFQIIDPFSQSTTPPAMHFIIDNREVVHLNTDKELVDRLIKDSQVLTVNETWDWEMIVLIFKTNMLFFLQRMDEVQIKFLRRIIDFFKPSSNRFSHSELTLGRLAAPSVHAGVELIDWYLRLAIVLEYLVQRHSVIGGSCNITTRHLAMIQTQFHVDCVKFLREFMDDLNYHLNAILTNKSAHDCLFSPQHMMSTMCQQYFLFINRFCQTEFGVQMMVKSGIFDTLERIVATTNHICYVKLIVTALDYSLESAEQTRRILELALSKSNILAGRMYATQFLLVLMRVKVANFHKWGIRLLVEQALNSTDKSICLAAMEILEEACHEELYLREMIEMWPEFSAEKCDDSATLLRSHFYSQVAGLEHAKANVKEAVELWDKGGYCKRYVLLVEAETHASQTLHSKNEDGSYCRRSFSSRSAMIPPNLLPHLFGQLARTRQGCAVLKEHCDLGRHVDLVLANKCDSEESVLVLKASLYALGNIMTSELGVELLKEVERFEALIPCIVEFVKYNQVYSVRATSLNVLGLIGCTNLGANMLYELDWLCVRHGRNTMWPVSDHEEFYSQMMLWSNQKHSHDEGIFWPPDSFNPLDMSGVSSRPLESSLAEEEDAASDAVDGPLRKSSESATSEIQSADVSPKNSAASGGSGKTVKSPMKHVRSLSESKTTEGLHMWREQSGTAGAMGGMANASLGLMFLGSRQRINSGTDSNTSGVSSCDSTGRNNFTCDLQQTLSPIPSTSDLMEYRKTARPSFDKYNRWYEEQFRKISLTGQTVRDVKINPQDVQGYAKIRYIKRNQRPVVSESAAEDLIAVMNVFDDDHNEGHFNPHYADGDDFRMPMGSKYNQQQQQRNIKVRSLDRQQQGLVISQSSILKIRESSELSVQSTESLTSMSSKVITTATPPPVDDLLLELSSALAGYRIEDGVASEGATHQPCFMGICLPRNILNLFPRQCPGKPYVGMDVEATNTANSNTLTATALNDTGEEEEEEREVNGVEVADEVDNVAAGVTSVHQGQEAKLVKLCLNCSRVTATSTANKTSSNSSSSSNPSPGLSKHHKKLIMLRNVTDSRRIKGSLTGEGVDEEDHTLLAILVNVQRCANPVLMKQAKLNLLELKQKHGEYFQDLCLYSEVLKAIGRNTYRQTSRRFLQELFLDIDFETLLADVMQGIKVEARVQLNGTKTESGALPGKDTTSYGSMIHSPPEGDVPRERSTNAVELRNGRRECEKIKEEETDEVDGVVASGKPAGIRMSLPEPIQSPTRSTTSGESESNGGGSSLINKGFARVQLSCSVNKFPVRRDRANSLNATAKDL